LHRTLACTALVLAACAAPDPPEPEPASAETADEAESAPDLRVHVTDDGNEMPYVVRGDGATTVVLVHCWMCDRTFWDAQIPVLEERYRVIALDLPGHGEADVARQTWSVEGFGRDVAGLLEELDLADVILVGHSMGGPVALKAAALSAGRVDGIVAVDTLHDAEFDWNRPEIQETMARFDADFRGTCSAFLDSMFVEDGVEHVAARVRRTGCETSNATVGRALLHDFARIDMPAWLREAGVPIRAINAAQPNETKLEINRKYADFDVVLMEGVGHYPHMTRPEEFNRHLLATLAELAG
jgi:pimeloyl-ACP methyl ester carboxylesterase